MAAVIISLLQVELDESISSALLSKQTINQTKKGSRPEEASVPTPLDKSLSDIYMQTKTK